MFTSFSKQLYSKFTTETNFITNESKITLTDAVLRQTNYSERRYRLLTELWSGQLASCGSGIVYIIKENIWSQVIVMSDIVIRYYTFYYSNGTWSVIAQKDLATF